MGWLPPSWRPSSACLALGTRVFFQPLHAVEGCTTPGRRLFRWTGLTLVTWIWGLSTVSVYGVSGTSWAIAHINARSARAMATTTWVACLPRAIRGRERLKADLGVPTEVRDGLGPLLSAQWEMPTDLGRSAGGPGPCAQGPAGRGRPGLGDAACWRRSPVE